MRYSSHLTRLAELWLHEPNAAQIENARAVLGLDCTGLDATELATAYADLFLLNVYPYASVFCEFNAEMNGARAQTLEHLYDEFAFAPDALTRVGALDHLGMMLQFLETAGDAVALPLLLDWAPVLCFAVEREPGAHLFYRALARETLQRLFLHARAAAPISPTCQEIPRAAEDENSLHDIVQFFLAPARCGVFFSRAQLGQIARRMGQRLPFGSRADVARALFMNMGETANVDALLKELQNEIVVWSSAYVVWTRECAAWKPFAAQWLERTTRAHTMTQELRAVLARPLELEFAAD